jgi:hypothetical protein
MPIYEFLCESGHVSEELVPLGTELLECPRCLEHHPPMMTYIPPMYPAKKILSATRTDFRYADTKLKR